VGAVEKMRKEAGMEPFEIGLLVCVILLMILVAVLAAMLLRRTAEPTAQKELQEIRSQMTQALTSLDLFSNRVESLDRSVNERLSEARRSLEQRLESAASTFGDVKEGLGKLEKEAQRIREIGQDISSLHDILRAPKPRGVLGEFFLEELLGQILPPANFELQHQFSDGVRVDAAVKVGEKLVPVDSKFPLESFQRMTAAETEKDQAAARRDFIAQAKKHIEAIAGKYIRPQEGTFDFALMYVPAENVYYEMLVGDSSQGESLASQAWSKRVFPVSPVTFYMYLQAIALGLRGMQIEKRAEQILSYLSQLKRDLGRFRSDFDTVGTHISHAVSKYEEADKKLSGVEGRLETLPENEEEAGELPPSLPV
jgi:DNA recombination protein RmuC